MGQRLRAVALAVAAGVILALTFALGVVIGARNGWLQPVVTVTIVNQTGQPLSDLRLVYSSSRSRGTVEFEQLPPGQRLVARFHVPGEASYTITAKRADGKTLEHPQAYVEPGYAMTEVLSDSRGTSSMGYRSADK
jgi:hypothetical protein